MIKSFSIIMISHHHHHHQDDQACLLAYLNCIPHITPRTTTNYYCPLSLCFNSFPFYLSLSVLLCLLKEKERERERDIIDSNVERERERENEKFTVLLLFILILIHIHSLTHSVLRCVMDKPKTHMNVCILLQYITNVMSLSLSLSVCESGPRC